MQKRTHSMILASVVATVAGSACAQHVPENECGTTFTAEEALRYMEMFQNMPMGQGVPDGPVVVQS